MTWLTFSDLFGGLVALLLGVLVVWASYLVGCRLVSSEAPVSARWSAAAVAAAWLLVSAFWLLVPFGLFRLPAALVLFASLAAVLHRRLAPPVEPLARLRADLRRVREVAGACIRTPAGWAVSALAAVAAVRLLRGTAAPPLGWDTLTYHLYKAGRWVQLGTLAPQPAPDAWSYYEYFPVVGDVFWAWVMLPVRSDLLLTAAGTAVWGALLLGVYAAAREMGAPPRRAALAGSAVCAMPSALAYLSSGYVDNTVAALFALGAVFVLRTWRHGRIAEAPLAAGAMALMVGTKLTTAAFFAVAAVVLVIAVVRAQASARSRRLVLLGCLAAAAAGFPSYQRAWVEQGSPFHPFAIAFGDVVLSEGVDATKGVGDEIASWEGYALDSRLDFWRYFLYLPKLSGAFLNPGPGAALIAVLGVLGLVTAWRRGRRMEALFLAACAALMLVGFLSGNMETFRTTFKVTTAGRYVTAGIVAAAILGAAWPARIAEMVWLIATAAGLLLSFPRSWVEAELPAVAAVSAVALGVVSGLFVVAWWWRRSGRKALPAVAAVVLAVVGLAVVEGVRRSHRYTLYAATVDSVDPLFHMHGLHPVYASAWPIWRHLDDPEGHRIAVTAGWDGLGHNWYRYPLLGSRLQNRVLYVPVTADGGVVDYRKREEVAERASFRAWLARLVEEGVELVVSLAPRTTIEDVWMANTPSLFTPELTVPGDFHVAYRLDRDRALEALARISEAERPAPQVP